MPFPVLLAAAGIAAAGQFGSAMIRRNAAGDASSAVGRAAGVGVDAAKSSSTEAVQGLKKARQAGLGQLSKGLGYLEPFAQSGQEANQVLSNLLFGEPDEQAAAFALYEQSPGLQDIIHKTMGDIDQRGAHQGSLRSGNTMRELLLSGGRLRAEDFYRWRDMLQGQGAQGFQAASGMADIRTNMAGLTADTHALQGGIRANRETDVGQFRMKGILGESFYDQVGQGALATGISQATGTLAGPLSSSIGRIFNNPTPTPNRSPLVGM